MNKCGIRFAAAGFLASFVILPASAYADGAESEFVSEFLNSPSVFSSYQKRYRPAYDRPQVITGTPTNISTVRAQALPPEPLVPLVQSNLKPTAQMDIYATAVYEQLIGVAGELPHVLSSHRKEIIRFYKARDFKPLWLGEYGMAVRTKHLLSLLGKADEEGLRAQDYLPAFLIDFDAQSSNFTESPENLAQLEIELTVAALKYSHHISAGRVKPIRISKLHTLKARPESARKVLTNLQSTLRPDKYLNSLQPMIPQYRFLKKALAKYRVQVSDNQTIHISAGDLIRPGDFDDRLELIAKRLEQLGLYSFEPLESINDNDSYENEASSARSQELIYDANLVAAIKELQEQSGLRRDGIIGNNTLAALNGQSSGEKISKIILSLERLRWLPQDLKSKYIFINQAFYETWMMQDGKEIFRSDVIVGKSIHQTAVFNDEMDKVVLNPRWFVPRSIIYNEMVPKLYNNPYYLAEQGYEVRDIKGRQVNSSTINWSQFSEKNIPFNVVQPPGPKNALGRVKFLFPNQHAIYMHDTPARNLFKKDNRALSHGCVRVQKPMEFAEIILKTEGWTPAKIAAAIATGKNQTVLLSKKIPVYLGYYTAWADQEGNVRLRDDVYGRDRVLNQALEQNYKARQTRKYTLND